MSTVQAGERAGFRAGTSSGGTKVGYETATGAVHVLRYAFTTPADGVSRLSFSGEHLAHGASYAWQGLGYAVSTSPTGYIGATPSTPSLGTLTITGTGKDYIFSAPEAAINLPAGTTAYIFIFPVLAQYFFWDFQNVPSLTVTTAAGSSAIASITQSVETLGTLTVTAGKAVESFRHKLTITAGGQTLHSSDLFDTSYSVTVPRDWFAAFPAATALNATAELTTYNGDTQVGAAATAAVTITADDGMRPAIADGWATAAAYNEGAAAALLGYIAGYSKAEISFDSSKLTQAAGAALASVTVSVSGAVISTAPYRTPVLTGASDVVCTATDTRGRTAVQTIRIEPMEYAPPTLSSIKISRCTAAGVDAEDGNYYTAKATAACSSLDGQNSVTLTAAHKVQGGVYGAETALVSGTASVIGPISPDSTYQVRLTATDTLGNTAVTVSTLPTRQWALKFRADGLGAAFGKAPERSKAIELPEGWQIWIGNETIKQSIIDALLPVGIYITLSEDTDPATLWGGTWERLEEGRTIIAAGSTYTAGSTGGEATHQLTTAEMPAHSHTQYIGTAGGGDIKVNADYTDYTEVGRRVVQFINTGDTGGGAAHNNMPPYIAAYIWHRIG